MRYELTEGELIYMDKKHVGYYVPGDRRVILSQPSYIRADELNLVGARVKVLAVEEEGFVGEPFARVEVSYPETPPVWVPYSCLS